MIIVSIYTCTCTCTYLVVDPLLIVLSGGDGCLSSAFSLKAYTSIFTSLSSKKTWVAIPYNDVEFCTRGVTGEGGGPTDDVGRGLGLARVLVVIMGDAPLGENNS